LSAGLGGANSVKLARGIKFLISLCSLLAHCLLYEVQQCGFAVLEEAREVIGPEEDRGDAVSLQDGVHCGKLELDRLLSLNLLQA
jgi:hypothetical protein